MPIHYDSMGRRLFDDGTLYSPAKAAAREATDRHVEEETAAYFAKYKHPKPRPLKKGRHK